MDSFFLMYSMYSVSTVMQYWQ